MSNSNIKISVIGCGYVGLPLIKSLSRHYLTTGYDINKQRINELKNNKNSNEIFKKKLSIKKNITFTNKFKDIVSSNVFIITLPTPLDKNNLPHLEDIKKLSRKISKILKKGDIVIYESTVYPGATEDVFIPELLKENNLKLNKDFWVGYSPERINPGDTKNTLEKIKKIVSASDEKGLKIVKEIYSKIIKAGIHSAKNIKVAELSKVLENTQRFVNIALINEIAVLCDHLSISTKDVINAAATKWNFIKFQPGLVGGHCIAVDPMYLLYKSNKFRFPNDIIYSSQKINRYMSKFVINKISAKKNFHKPTLIIGLAFKKNCKDTRNSGVFDLIKNLNKIKIIPDVYDPLINLNSKFDLKFNLIKKIIKKKYKNIIFAVAHDQFMDFDLNKIKRFSLVDKVNIIDLTGNLKRDDIFFQL